MSRPVCLRIPWFAPPHRARLVVLALVSIAAAGCDRRAASADAPRGAAIAAPSADGTVATSAGSTGTEALAPPASAESAPPSPAPSVDATPAAPDAGEGAMAGAEPPAEAAAAADGPERRAAAKRDVTPPSRPERVAAEGQPGAIQVSWSRATDDVGVVRYEVVRDGETVASTRATRFVDRELAVLARHCYAVAALDAAGNRSATGEPVCGEVPDVTPPSVPAELRASAHTETAIDLVWAASTDDVRVARYEVMDERGAKVAAVGETRFTAAGLATGVERCLAVRACDAAGNCSAPSRPVCETPPDLTPPTGPATLTAVAAWDRRIELRWSAARDNVAVARYAIRRDGAPTIVVDGSATSAHDDHVAPTVRYCYTVVAEDAAGHASPPSPVACATPPDLVPPTTPPRVAVRARSGTRVAVAWGPSSDDIGVAGYELVRGGTILATTSRLQATMGGLAPGAETCWSVRAFDAAGNRSAPSAPACVTTPDSDTPTAPWDLRISAGKTRELVLAWEPSPDPGVVYAVYWDSKSSRGRRVATTPSSTFRLYGHPAAEHHCYRVTAVDQGGRESDATFEACGRAGTMGQVAAAGDIGSGSP